MIDASDASEINAQPYNAPLDRYQAYIGTPDCTGIRFVIISADADLTSCTSTDSETWKVVLSSMMFAIPIIIG